MKVGRIFLNEQREKKGRKQGRKGGGEMIKKNRNKINAQE